MVTQHGNHVTDKETLPHDTLEISAWTEDGLVMAAWHKKYHHIQDIQFNPECVVMDEGRGIFFPTISRFSRQWEIE